MASTAYTGIDHGLQIGNNYGSLTAEFHLRQRLETPPSPGSTVPFQRDPDFVNRDKILSQIDEKTSVPGCRIALVGLGGVGKSQLVIEYCYRIRSLSPTTWVFWVHASSAARFEQGFRDMADYVKIPGRQNPNVNIFPLVQQWLRDETKGNWVLILDNVDDDWFISEHRPTRQQGQANHPTQPLFEYIPRSPNGCVIVTSRASEVAMKIVDRKDLLMVEPMARSEALELMQKKLEIPKVTDEVSQLVEELEFIPLAITQAAAFITARAPRYSVSHYLEKFRKSDREATRLLKNEGSNLYRDWEQKVRFRLRGKFLSTVYGRMMVSLGDIYQSQSKLGKAETQQRQATEALKGNLGEDHLWTLISMSNLATTLSRQDRWEEANELHTEVVEISRTKLGTDNLHTLSFIANLASVSNNQGRWDESERLQLQVMEIRERKLGKDHPDTIRTMDRLASIDWEQDRFAEAEQLVDQVIEMRKRKLGADHPETLKSMSSLAVAYYNQGLLNEAEAIQIHVMETFKTKYGQERLDTFESMANLASTYHCQSRWEEAEKLQIQVMVAYKEKLGEQHPGTLESITELASTYRKQRRWEDAEKLETQVMETRKVKVGKDHPEILRSMANLGLIFWEQCQWAAAEQVFLQISDIGKIKLGEDHPDTLTNLSNLASSYQKQGRLEEAEKLQIHLASTYSEQGRWEDAEKLQIHVLETRKSNLGDDHPDALKSMANLALTYRRQGRLEEAEKIEVHVMGTRKIILGEDDPDTLLSMASLAFTWKGLGQTAEALNLLRDCVSKQKRVVPPNHPMLCLISRLYLNGMQKVWTSMYT
ncbi:hypothetical protein N7488_002591 [Penicillium malachiteum]|nr:hypothetical protein N7488_002591 [Penicillium malachiteum]